MPTLKEWLKGQKSNWNLLFAAGTWIAAIPLSIVLSPDAVSKTTEYFPWMTRLSVFIVAVIVGITFIFASILNKREHVYLWTGISIILLIGSVWAVVRYYNFIDSLTCSCGKQQPVKGFDFKDAELLKKMYPQGVDCSTLCEKFKDQSGTVLPNKIWTENSINENRETLILSYFLCIPLFALTIISVVQAIYCKKENQQKRRPYKKNTKNSDKIEGETNQAIKTLSKDESSETKAK